MMSNKPRKTHSQFVDEIKELVGNEYKVIGTYKTSRTKIEMKHNHCPENRIWSITPDNFLRGSRCPTCSHKNKKRSMYRKGELDKELLDYALKLLNMSKKELEYQFKNNESGEKS